ncbi:hypothetical protein COOONC_08076 [Cooperia oncophora]
MLGAGENKCNLSPSSRTVQRIHASLSLVNKTIRGTVTPDKSTLEVIKSLQLHQAKSVQELVANPDKNDFRKTPVDFSKLFRPGRLLNALRQVTARSSGCTMDMLRLSSAWDASLIANDISIQVQGILLQGALFDGKLRDTVASSPPVTNAPQLTLGWTKIGSPAQYKENESVAVPLYTDVTRSEYIATVIMPCSDVHKWNIAAVALFLR